MSNRTSLERQLGEAKSRLDAYGKGVADSERDPSPEAAALRRDAASSIGRLVDELAQDDPALAHATGRDQSDDQE